MSTPQVTWDTPQPRQQSPQSAPQVSWGSTPADTDGDRQEQPDPQESLFHEIIDMGRLGKSLIQSKMIGIGDPALAYKYQDYLESRLKDIGGDFAARVSKAATVKDDPLYMLVKHHGPEPFESQDVLENFIHDISEFVGDPTLYGPAIAGSLAGFPKLGNLAGFTLDAGLRKALADKYTKGDVQSFGELASRAASTMWAATKGLATGGAMELAGGIPVPKFVGEMAGNILRGTYQAAAMTTVGGLLDGQVPKLQDFERSAITVTGLNLITHTAAAVLPKQGLLDVYADTGKTPQETAVKLQAQPPVKQPPAEGLRPAIRITAKDGSKQTIIGDEGETHSDLAERVLGQRPVTVEQLETDPKLADKVLAQPEMQVQQVIDRAVEIKAAAGEEVPAKPESGRGFASLNSEWMNRLQSRNWVKKNEPQVHDMWGQITGDDKAELHSADYSEARSRVQQRGVMEGEPKLDGVSGELQQYLAKNRTELNAIKAGNESDGYIKSVIRSTFVNVRNFVRATGEQYASRIAKILPDTVDQEALTFLRDYRDSPDQLRAEIENIRSGDNERLKPAIPAMERALDPTPKMLEADHLMTEYFKQALDLRSQFVGVGSSVGADRYSPRNFILTEEDAAKGAGSGKFSKRSPHDIQRSYLHVLDPLQSGNVEARTFNAIDGLRVYGDRLSTSVARNVFEMELKNTELAKNGVAGQVPPELKSVMADANILSSKEIEELGGIPKDWVSLQGTEKTIVSGGKQFRTGLQVPPKVAEAMEPILQHDVLSGAKYWKVAKLAQSYIKAIELGLSPFHMRALAVSFMNNAGIDAYREALRSDNNSPEFEAQERKAALYGVTTTKTGTPIEAYRGLKPSSLESRDTLLAKIKSGYEPVDKLFKSVTKATFDVAQRKFKVIDFSAKEAQWLAKHPNATEAEYGTAMRGIAKEINAVYGGLNWEVMGVSQNFQAVARMFLLAPDWTFSNVANLKYAGEGGAAGNAARAFWIKSFATGYAMTQGMSLFASGQMSPHPFTRGVYLGKDDKGKEMYSQIFFVGAPKDAIGLINSTARGGFPTGTVNFAINKSAPLIGTGLRLAENKDWQGKPITKPKDTGLEKTGKELEFSASQLFPAPFVIKDIAGRVVNPDEDLTYKDFLAAVVGASVYHDSPKKDKSSGRSYKGFRLPRTPRASLR